MDKRRLILSSTAGYKPSADLKEPVSKFGDALGQLLADTGVSQAELGRRLEVSGQAVNQWVAGDTRPTRVNVETIEDVLAVEPRGLLLALAGYEVEDHDVTIESVIRADKTLPAEDKRVLLRMVAALRRNAEAD